MSNLTAVYKHKVKSTGEIIEELEYTGLYDVDAVRKFTDCAPHDLYYLSEKKDDVGCMINVPADNEGGFDKLKIWPKCHIIKRANGSIEVWNATNQSIPCSDLEILSKDYIIT